MTKNRSNAPWGFKKDGTPRLKPGKPANPNKQVKQPSSFVRSAIRPQVWTTGPDPKLHSMLIPYLRHKAQAKFRNEPFEVTFEEWSKLWWNMWEQRGRKPHEFCMTREDEDGAWTLKNILIISREDHFKSRRNHPNQGRGKTGKNPRYKPAL